MDLGIAWLPALVGVAAGAARAGGSGCCWRDCAAGSSSGPGSSSSAAALVTGLGVGLSWPEPLVALVVWAGLLAVALGAVDLVHHRLPDALTLPAIPITG